jgi:DegV family protein with EDD domain
VTTAIMVDSSSGITPDLARDWGVHIVPLYVDWGGASYRDNVEALPADFYEQLRRSGTPPKTSAPNPSDFLAGCHTLMEAGHDEVVIITVSSRISAAHQNASIAARELGADRVTAVDSGTGAGAHALLAAEAAARARSGATAAEIVTTVHTLADRLDVYIVMDTLTYLRKSGRISLAKAMAGNAIGMRPVIGIADGQLALLARPRGRPRAIAMVRSRLLSAGRPAARALAMYTDDPADGEAWAAFATAHLGASHAEACPLSPVVGGSCGPGSHGVAVLWQ